MECRECGKKGATNEKWGLCSKCFKWYKKMGRDMELADRSR